MGETIRTNSTPNKLERLQLKKNQARLRGREKERGRGRSLGVIQATGGSHAVLESLQN